MSEQEANDVVEDVIEGEEQAEPPKAPDGFVSIEDNTHQVNKQHKKFRDEERARVAVEEQNAALKKELNDLKASSVDLTIPPIPDPLDENYEARIAERDAKIKAVAGHEAQLEAKQDQISDSEQQAKNSQAEAKNDLVQSFASNSVTLGLNPIETTKASEAVADYGVANELEDALLQDPEGPLFVHFLAQNPVKLHELNNMSPFQAYRALEELRPQAQLLKPKTSGAPPPPDTLSGGGVGELEHSSLDGAKFS